MNETQLRELILKAISEAVGDTAGAQSAAPVPPASGAVESGEVRDLSAVDFRQMARMVHVTAQRADAAFASDAEYDGAVACRVAYAPLSVAAHLDLAQRPGEAVRIGQRGQVLAQCEHGFTDCVSCCRG